MTTTITAIEAHALVERDAETKSRPEVRDVRATLLPGKAVRQGDVYLVRCRDGVRVTAERIESRQLVDGTSAGSRHIVEGHAAVYATTVAKKDRPKCVRSDALLGPVIAASGEFVVTHPEHAHVRCPAGVYQVIHQLDAATRQRVQD